MSWGAEGEARRERMKIELALTRAPLYRLKQAASDLRHPEKGPDLRTFVDEVYIILDRIESTLRR